MTVPPSSTTRQPVKPAIAATSLGASRVAGEIVVGGAVGLVVVGASVVVVVDGAADVVVAGMVVVGSGRVSEAWAVLAPPPPAVSAAPMPPAPRRMRSEEHTS